MRKKHLLLPAFGGILLLALLVFVRWNDESGRGNGRSQDPDRTDSPGTPEKGPDWTLRTPSTRRGIRLRFVDTRDAPVAGIRAGLVPAGLGETETRWCDALTVFSDDAEHLLSQLSPRIPVGYPAPYEWIRTSDTGGVIEWLDLPAAAGYRWALVSDLKVQMNPPHEIQAVQFMEDGSIVYQDPPPKAISGSISLDNEEVAEFRVRAVDETAVAGVLVGPDGMPAAGATINLHHREVLIHPDSGREIPNVDFEVQEHADASGRFLLRNLRAGTKSLSIQWNQTEDHVQALNLKFKLEEGEFKDLGKLVLGKGHAVSFLIELEGAEPHELWEGPPERWYIRMTLDTPESKVDESYMVLAPVGIPLHLSGLPAGQAYARLTSLNDDDPNTGRSRMTYGLTWPDARSFSIPTDQIVEFKLHVERTYPLTVVPVYPGAATPALEGVLLDPESLEVKDGVHEGEGNASVKPGRYLLVLHSHAGHSNRFRPKDHGANLFGEVEVEVTENQTAHVAEVRLGRGAILRGRMVGPDGGPPEFPSTAVEYTFTPGRRGQVAWAETDGDGSFVLSGVRPNTRIYLNGGGDQIVVQSPGPGEEIDVGVLHQK